jgi:two-component system, response regulator PdtaR
MEKKKILVVEDEFVTVAALKISLKSMGCVVVATADTGEGAVKAAGEHKPDLVLMDIILKGEMNGITAADIIRQKYDIPTVFLTGQSDDATINLALESEPFGYIIKPFEEKNLKSNIMMALYKHSIDNKLKTSEERYRTIAELSEDGILVIANDYTVVYANGSAARTIQHLQADIADKPLNSLVTEAVFRQIRTIIEEVHATNTHKRMRLGGDLGNRRFWFDSTAIPLTSGEEEIRYVMIFMHDVTDQVRLEERMAKEGIIQLEKNMEQFLYLNDEIRNPLQVITGLTLLGEGEYQHKILEQAEKIDSLVSKLDMGWVETDKVRCFLLRHYRRGGESNDES